MLEKRMVLLLINFSIVLSLTKVSRFIISNDINNLKSFDIIREIFGTYLTFDKNAEFSFLPYEIFDIIYYYVFQSDEYLTCKESKININNTEFKAITCGKNILTYFENFNFITAKYAIKFSNEMLFVLKDNLYYLRFVSSRNVEHIVLDKEIINLMNIEFLDNDNFIINNKECYSELKD